MNVIRWDAAIKWPVPAFPQIIAAGAVQTLNAVSRRLPEQLLSRRAVGLGTMHMRFDTSDLDLERLDPGLQLLDRHGVEVLLCKGDERVVGLAWEQLVQIHRGVVDPTLRDVNKRGP